jgi:hypothetical protein
MENRASDLSTDLGFQYGSPPLAGPEDKLEICVTMADRSMVNTHESISLGVLPGGAEEVRG